MKTTVELSDTLFASAKLVAQRNQTTLRALIEEGLRYVISEAPKRQKANFKLRDLSVGGGEMLLTDPSDWKDLETEHLTRKLQVRKG